MIIVEGYDWWIKKIIFSINREHLCKQKASFSPPSDSVAHKYAYTISITTQTLQLSNFVSILTKALYSIYFYSTSKLRSLDISV